MQTPINLPTSDNHIIYGTLDQRGNKKENLIIFCHGLTGSPNEAHYLNAADFFCNKGYDIFRFAFYTGNTEARQLSECSIKIHAQDIETVLSYFQPLYQKIILIGHSLGCLAILGAHTDGVNQIIHWDPSRGTPDLEKRGIIYLPSLDKYVLRRGKETLISKEMAQEMLETAKHLEDISKKVSSNTAFVFAQDYSIYDAWKPFVQNYDVKIIPGASHTFREEGKIRELYEATLELIKKRNF